MLQRRFDTKHADLIQKLIAAGTIPLPESVFTNSLFVEIDFLSDEDVRIFDAVCRLALIISN